MQGKITTLPQQPPVWLSYFRSGKLLYLSMILFILESWIYWVLLDRSIRQGNNIWIIFWTSCFLFSFVHIFLVLADGWSRFQNYKRVKDQLFLYGFNPRFMSAYMGSKCQRMAALTAAAELGLEEKTQQFFYDQGYRWYHWVPDFMMNDPFFLIRNYFWQRTFLEKNYSPRVNFHAEYQQLQTV